MKTIFKLDIAKDLSGIIKNTLENNDLKYETTSSGLFFCGFNVKGHRIRVNLFPGPRFMVIQAVYRFSVKPDDFNKMVLKLNAINNELPVGCFELNEDGDVHCKNSFHLFNRLPTQDEVFFHIMTTLALAEANYNDIVKDFDLTS